MTASTRTLGECVPQCMLVVLAFLILGSPHSLGADVADPDVIENSVGMKLRRISAGKFLMGIPDQLVRQIPAGAGAEKERFLESQPVHEVEISKPFYFGIHEVSCEQWTKVMGSPAPCRSNDATAPVSWISWHDAKDFCRELSDLEAERTAGRIYRLPTEAEWEYACRAGTQTKWPFGDGDARLLTFCHCRSGKPAAVGSLKPNPWGLYDMQGNVWEWCSDWHDPYPKDKVTDPRGPRSGENRIYRGGSYDASSWLCLSSFRGAHPPEYKAENLGMRVVIDLGDVDASEYPK